MRRSLVEVALAIASAVLAWAAFGWPDGPNALGLVRTAHPTHAEVIAGVGILAWCAVALFSVRQAVRVLRSAGPWSRAVVTVALGCTVLTAGAVVHAHRGYETCCGSTEAAQQALGTAP